ncbi:MAG: rRNA maturation RNase YbeY [Minisyncoccia bacterium]|jgi:probable rRNA maturation factor
MLDLTFNNNLKTEKIGRDLFYEILKKAVSATGLAKKNIGLSLNLVGEEKIRSLNRDYREKDKATDVLSFPLNEITHRNLTTDAKIQESDILELGDIFICLPVARKNALKEKIDLKTKLEFLAVHGFLHLLGYDHETPAGEKRMTALQKKIIKSE